MLPGAASIAAGMIEGALGEYGGIIQSLAQGLAVGELSILLATDQPVSALLGAGRLDEQLVEEIGWLNHISLEKRGRLTCQSEGVRFQCVHTR